VKIGETWVRKHEHEAYHSPVQIIGFEITERGEEVLFLPLEDEASEDVQSAGKRCCHFPRLGFLQSYKRVYE